MKRSSIRWIILLAVAFIWLSHSLIQALLIEDLTLGQALVLKVQADDMVFRFFVILLVILLGMKVCCAPRRNHRYLMDDLYIPENRANHLNPATRNQISRFVHEIRTQLHNIVGFSQLLEKKPLRERDRNRYLHYIENSKRAMGRAVDELYTYQRAKTSGKKNGQSAEIFPQDKWKGKTILVADDVQTNYMLLKLPLQRTGAEILWAKNGKEAVDLFRETEQVDLVLMDILMPEMDGFEATRKIKEINPEVPVVAQTAYSYDEMAVNYGAAPFDGYLIKPIWHVDLYKKCSRFLGK
ncbi:MAG: response regulator [Bacteroidales bacterium]